jgi:hypothetical protein
VHRTRVYSAGVGPKGSALERFPDIKKKIQCSPPSPFFFTTSDVIYVFSLSIRFIGFYVNPLCVVFLIND